MRSGRSNQPTLQSSPSPSARARVYDTMNEPTSASIASRAMARQGDRFEPALQVD